METSSLLQRDNFEVKDVMFARDPASFNAPYSNLAMTQKAVEAGRQDLLSDILSKWRRERMINAGISEENIDRIINTQKGLVERAPLDFSKTEDDLEALGATSPRPKKVYTLPDGTTVSDYNTGLDVSIAKGIGSEARKTAFHELGHYALSNATGTTSGAHYTNYTDPLFAPVAYDYPASGERLISRGDAWQHRLIDYNQSLLPPKDAYYESIMNKRFDVRNNPAKVKGELIKNGKSEEEADKIVKDIQDADYMWSAQEQDRHLKEFFHYDVLPLLENPNDAAEIERILTKHPEIINNNPSFKKLMTKIKPGSNKDYAKALAGMISTLPVINTLTNNK